MSWKGNGAQETTTDNHDIQRSLPTKILGSSRNDVFTNVRVKMIRSGREKTAWHKMHKTCLSRRPFIPDIIMVCQKTVARDRGLCRLTCRLLIKVLVFVSQEQKFIQEPIEINHASSMCFLPERKKITKKCPFEIRLGFLTSPSCAKLWFHLPEFTQLPNSLIPMELYNLFE